MHTENTTVKNGAVGVASSSGQSSGFQKSNGKTLVGKNNKTTGTATTPSVNSASTTAAASSSASSVSALPAHESKNSRDIFVATAALDKKNMVKFPDPNNKGNIDTIPLEKLDPAKKKFIDTEREKNLYDTSIPITDEAKMIDKFLSMKTNNNDGDEFEEFIQKTANDPSNAFPCEEVASFHPSLKIAHRNTKYIRGYIQEYFYSDYFYNTSLVAGTSLFSYFLATWRFSFLSLLIVFFVTGSLYKMEFRRYTRNIRDDIKRLHMHETLSDRTETTIWLNSFVSKFWIIYMPTLSEQVKDNVNPALEDVTPGYGIDALTLDEFTLGTKAPTIDSIQTYTKRGKDIVEMDWKFSFTPNDTSNMTENEVKSKINPKIALGVTIGKGLVSKSLPVLVEDINVSAHARITIELGNNFPNVKIVSVSLLEPPLIDFALKPVGGETLGLDIMSFLPGLKTFMTSTINSIAGPMLYAPNKLDIDVEEIIANSVNDCIGLVAVTIEKASDLEPFENGQFNPYVSITTEDGPFNSCPEKFDTSVLKDFPKDGSGTPSWSTETKYVFVNSLDQKLNLNLMSKHMDSNKDHVIGKTAFDLSKLYERSEFSSIKGKLYRDKHDHDSDDDDDDDNEDEEDENETQLELEKFHKSKGVLKYSISWIPVAETTFDTKDAIDVDKKKMKDFFKDKVTTEGTEEAEENDETTEGTGILKLTLKSVSDLDTSKSPYGLLNPTAELFIEQKLATSFRALKRINEPSWEEVVEVLVPSKNDSEIKLVIYDTQFGVKEKLCEYIGDVADLQHKWDTNSFTFKAQPFGSIKMNGMWKPLKMESQISSSNKTIGSTKILGALRVHLRDGHFHSGDLAGVGDVDPYVNICLNDVIKFKTNYYSSNKKPIFNAATYIPITSENQLLKLDVFDYQSVGDDRALGSYQFPVLDYLEKDDETGIYKLTGSNDKVQTVTLVNPKTHVKKKSILNISVSFIPVLSIYSPDEYESVEELKKKIKELDMNFVKEQDELRKEMAMAPNDYELVDVDDVEDNIYSKKLHEKREIPFEEIISKNNSGVFAFEIVQSAGFKHGSYLQVLVDDLSYPAFISSKNKNGKFNHSIGLIFIRDLKNSKIIFRLSKKPIVKNTEDIIEEFTTDVLTLLKNSYKDSKVLEISNGGKLELKAFLYPTCHSLSDTETLSDTGLMKLDILNAIDLISHDRNGKSDPFVEIKVDGELVYKTEVVKKNLDPTWNESCTVPIPSRSRSKIVIEVYDWDRTGSNDLLCTTLFPTQDLLINGKPQSWKLSLNPKGTIFLNSVFQPQYCRPAVDAGEGGLAGMPLKFLGGAASMGVGVAGVGVGAAGDIAGFGVSNLTKGAGKGGKFFKKTLLGGGRHHSSNSTSAATSSSEPTADSTANVNGNEHVNEHANGHVNGHDASRSSIDYDKSVPNQSYSPVLSNNNNRHLLDQQRTTSTAQSGTTLSTVNLTAKQMYSGHIEILQAQGLGQYVQIRTSYTINGKLKQLHKTETRRSDKEGNAYFGDVFDFKAPPEAHLVFGAVAHHTFGKDTELGVAQIHLADPQIQQEGQMLFRLGKGALIVKVTYAQGA